MSSYIRFDLKNRDHVLDQFVCFFNPWIQLVSTIIYETLVKGLSSWKDRNGVINTYWSGIKGSSQTGCQCSQDGTCIETPNAKPVCNCDTFGMNLIDDGILFDKTALPVKSLNYGGSITPFSSIKYTLGPLVCRGKAGISQN